MFHTAQVSTSRDRLVADAEREVLNERQVREVCVRLMAARSVKVALARPPEDDAPKDRLGGPRCGV